MKYFLIFLLLTSVISNISAGESNNSQFGAHRAVTAFSKEEGFKISAKAASSLNIKFQVLQNEAVWKVPAESLVRIKQSYGVYRRLEGWISFVLIKIAARTGDIVTITSSDLEAGDEIAVSGARFLRMADADLNSDTVDNCSH